MDCVSRVKLALLILCISIHIKDFTSTLLANVSPPPPSPSTQGRLCGAHSESCAPQFLQKIPKAKGIILIRFFGIKQGRKLFPSPSNEGENQCSPLLATRTPTDLLREKSQTGMMDYSEHLISQICPFKLPAFPEHMLRPQWVVNGFHCAGNWGKKHYRQKSLSSRTNDTICSPPVTVVTWYSFANLCHCCCELVTLNGSSLFFTQGMENCLKVILGQLHQFLV